MYFGDKRGVTLQLFPTLLPSLPLHPPPTPTQPPEPYGQLGTGRPSATIVHNEKPSKLFFDTNQHKYRK